MINKNFKNKYKSDGIVKIQKLIDKKILYELKKKINLVFNNLMIEKKIIKKSVDIFNTPNVLLKFKKKHLDLFLNVKLKAIQKFPEIYSLGNSQSIIKYLKLIGIKNPVYSTDPLIMMHHKTTNVSSSGDYAPLHQDWRSVQGSLNCAVLWIPIVEIEKKMGSIEYVPSSHILGLLPTKKHSWYRAVNSNYIKSYKLKTSKIKIGDAFLFSSLLAHKSGINKSNKIRVSLQFRYNDLEEKSYIERGYPCNYIHAAPKRRLLKKDVPSLQKVKNFFKYEIF
tara:strand:+ start:119 stop:958 length:840 start_codon:yes stop_codon:yes gene_type:complete